MNEIKVRHSSGMIGFVDAFDFYILEALKNQQIFGVPEMSSFLSTSELDFEDENGNVFPVKANELEVGL